MPSIRDTLDPAGLMHARDSSSFVGSPGLHSQQERANFNEAGYVPYGSEAPPVYDPNAPGSVFNVQRTGQQPYKGVPPAGSYTNGLRGGLVQGQSQATPDWSAIIAHALRK